MNTEQDAMTYIKGQFQSLHANVNEQYDSLSKRVSELDAVVLDVAQKTTGGMARSASTAPAGTLRRAITQKLIQGPEFKQLRERGVSTGRIDLGLDIKALTSLQGSPDSDPVGINVLPDKEIGSLYGYGMRPLRLLEAMTRRQVTSNQFSFNRMDSFTPSAAAQTGEGEDKAQQAIVPELVTCPIATVAVFQLLSSQLVEDEAGIADTVSAILAHTVLAEAERQALYGTGSMGQMRGILDDATGYTPVTASTTEDIVGEAAASLAADGYEAGVFVMHPADWFDVQSRKATAGGEYLVGSPAQPIPPSLWNMRGVISPAINQGDVLVYDPRYALLLDRRMVTAELFPQDGTNVQRNLLTLRVEGRWGVALLDTAAALKIELPT